VVSPTHAEAERTTAAIRSRLRADGVLGEEREFSRLVPAHLTDAQKADPHSYQLGDVLQFHKAAPGIKPGQRIEVSDATKLPLQHADRFSVYRKATMKLAVGDVVRASAGGSTKDGHRFENGSTYTVAGFSKSGDVQLSNGWLVPKEFGTWNHGYLSTSHSSQGRTVQRVLVVQSALSAPAASSTQAYVSVSRGKQQALVLTDQKLSLLEAVGRDDRRTSATEFAARARRPWSWRRRLQHHVLRLQRLAMTTPTRTAEIDHHHYREVER
jgi:hypothetical protein